MTNYISKEGLQKLKIELGQLKQKRYEIAKKIEEAKALGDLAENNEYHEARETQAFNEGRIRELEEKIRDAQVISGQGRKSSAVFIGSKIVVQNGGQQKEFLLVGSQEADPLTGKISNESPIGQAFLGKKAGDRVEVQTPGGRTVYKIISVN
ncbi:MAG: transcription elongation factor GreA [Candidatus Portnoybacteria bacterium CG10_big_fil_rev_8_21_14_0_10_44_7]|uniref:Transcription elongation factor GreA n=1 Tax=Candidatus Portnoybacteria bacterium CG10_big_fil_rev_8_21_14_0_10_44_7 TaxID=1974816 RepID=A0A2M8KID8_9BACT|nr:MAG: transcription elongation factor GreA [Candidatus Portnoybacteria bacterium CG10_big_fil_rev_8_21_14_0_10_44_7]